LLHHALVANIKVERRGFISILIDMVERGSDLSYYVKAAGYICFPRSTFFLIACKISPR